MTHIVPIKDQLLRTAPQSKPVACFSSWGGLTKEGYDTFDTFDTFDDIPNMQVVFMQDTFVSPYRSNFYSANIPGEARLSGSTAESVFSSKIDEAVPQRQQVIRHAGVYGGKARSQRYILRHFLKVATEVDERTDSGKLLPKRRGTDIAGV